MRRSVAFAITLAVLTFASSVSAAIQLTPISCVPAERNHAKVIATIPEATSVRLYFRAQQLDDQYYLEMLKDASGNWWAPIPIPASQTSNVVYRVVAKSLAGDRVSPDYVVPVTGSCAPFPLTAEEQEISQALVVGFLKDGTEVKGFLCVDIANRITPAGEMRRYEQCEPVAAISPIKNILIAAAATSVGVVGVVNTDNPPEAPISPVTPP